MANEQKLKNIHQAALLEFDSIQSTVRDERIQCLKDRRFYSIAGAQWEGKFEEQFENKPRLEVNKIHLSVIRIISEYRNNRITVDFVSKEGEEYDKLADTCDGLYRADEQDSVSDEAYDNAFEEAVGGGFGAWRLRAEYEDEYEDEDDRQRVRIEPIFDADSSVYFDTNAKRQDKSDAKSCFVLTAMTTASYKEEFDEDPASWPKEISETEFDWSPDDITYVAEYYKVEEKKETVHIYKTLDDEEERYTDTDFKDDEELEDTLEAIGTVKTGEKKVRRKKIHKYIMSGSRVLEDLGYIAGTCIPIVPVYGKRWFIDNVERYMGHVRLAKDAQMLKNMQLSKLAEISALSTVEKPIVTPEQISGNEQMWTDDNIKNFPYLLINPVTDLDGNPMPAGPLAYTRPPQIPPALAALLQLTEVDMQDILGNQNQGEQIMSNVSGKAVELVHNRLDMQTHIYMSNMAKSMKRSGEIWLSMVKDVYVETERTMKTVGKQGKVSSIELSKPVLVEGKVKRENDLSEAKFDIVADVGPSSTTKRQATVKDLIGMIQVTSNPEDVQVLSAMAMYNMEGEGLQDTRDYYRQKLINLGAVKPTEEEAQKLAEAAQNTQPNTQDLYFQAEAQKSEALAKKAGADTILTLAKVEDTQAKTVETLAGVDRDDREQLMQTVEKLHESISGES